jgi:NOL1/NOP2/fmu family ribosome biogenesis protein
LSPSSSRIRNVFEPLPASEVAELWQSRFGIPEDVFFGYQFFRKAKSIWAISGAALPRLSFESLGMRIMNIKDQPWKPTTCALQVFGRHAKKNLVHLDEKSAMLFLEGGIQEIWSNEKSDSESNPEPGYVVVFYRGEVLGCGLYSHGKLISQIPKERRAGEQPGR